MKRFSASTARVRAIEIAGVILSIVILCSLLANPSTAITTHTFSENSFGKSITPSDGITINLLSPNQIKGTAGQFATIKATITNLKANETIQGTAYISIVDINGSLPIDLEDWSAQKGFYVPPIEPHQSSPVEWNVRLVKAGFYTVAVLFSPDGDFSAPTASPRIFLYVAPKVNLNPSNVLPVALGVPILLVAAFATVNYRRGKRVGVY